MSKRLLEKTKEFFQKTLRVNSPENMTQGTTSCNTITIPGVTNQPIDLNVYIRAENDSRKSYFAAASSCVTSSVDSRPIVGIYYLNFAGMTDGNLREFLYFTTFAHELTHIFGFSSQLYSLYKKPDGTTRDIDET